MAKPDNPALTRVGRAIERVLALKRLKGRNAQATWLGLLNRKGEPDQPLLSKYLTTDRLPEPATIAVMAARIAADPDPAVAAHAKHIADARQEDQAERDEAEMKAAVAPPALGEDPELADFAVRVARVVKKLNATERGVLRSVLTIVEGRTWMLHALSELATDISLRASQRLRGPESPRTPERPDTTALPGTG